MWVTVLLVNLSRICLTKEILKDHIYGSSSGADTNDDEDDEPGDAEEQTRKDADVEPCFFHFLPKTVFDTLLTSWSISAVLDLSPGQGELAKSALEQRLPYCGICMTERHSVALKQERLSSQSLIDCCLGLTLDRLASLIKKWCPAWPSKDCRAGLDVVDLMMPCTAQQWQGCAGRQQIWPLMI